MANFCSNCGQPLSENDLKCPNCGQIIKEHAHNKPFASVAKDKHELREQYVHEIKVFMGRRRLFLILALVSFVPALFFLMMGGSTKDTGAEYAYFSLCISFIGIAVILFILRGALYNGRIRRRLEAIHEIDTGMGDGIL